jgi:hypothetical protein
MPKVSSVHSPVAFRVAPVKAYAQWDISHIFIYMHIRLEVSTVLGVGVKIDIFMTGVRPLYASEAALS